MAGGKEPYLANRIVISGEAGSGIYMADGSTVVDENGNVDAPLTPSEPFDWSFTSGSDANVGGIQPDYFRSTVTDGSTSTEFNVDAATFKFESTNWKLEVDANVLGFTSEAGDMALIAENDTTGGATYVGIHDSVNPAQFNEVVTLIGIGNNSVAAQVLYGSVGIGIWDTTDGAEYGYVSLNAAVSGSSTRLGILVDDGSSTVLALGHAGSPNALIGTDNNGNLTLEPDGTGVIIAEGTFQANQATVYAGDVVIGPGAIPLNVPFVGIGTTGTDAYTIADGVDGQEITIAMNTDNGDGTLTASTAVFTSIVFNDVGDVVRLRFITGAGWVVLYNNGCTIT